MGGIGIAVGTSFISNLSPLHSDVPLQKNQFIADACEKVLESVVNITIETGSLNLIKTRQRFLKTKH